MSKGSPTRLSPSTGVGTEALFQKSGIVYSDHHFKDKEGAYQSSPPKELKVLYDYLPTEREKAEKTVPTKVYMQADINALKAQTHVCGVYTLVHGEARPWKSTKAEQSEKFEGGKPMWKHTTEDLVLAADKVNGEDGWVVCKFTTFGTKKQCSMRVVGAVPPHDAKAAVWQEWDGRDWIPAPTFKCRPSCAQS